jgi:hypothetical protein
MMSRTVEDVAENSQYVEVFVTGCKLQVAVTVFNLLYTAHSSHPREAEYSSKVVTADDGLQRMNRALISNVA